MPDEERKSTDFESNCVKVTISKETCIVTQEAFDTFAKVNRVDADSDVRCLKKEDGTISLEWYGDIHTAFEIDRGDIAESEFDIQLLKDMIGTVEAPDSFIAFIDQIEAYDFTEFKEMEVEDFVNEMEEVEDIADYDALEEQDEEHEDIA